MNKNPQPMADFKTIKKHITVQQSDEDLTDYPLRKVNSNTYRGLCPLPSHPPGSKDESFSINADKQVWICHNKICYQNRSGRKKGGDVIELVAQHENISLRESGLRLAKHLPEISPSKAQNDSAQEKLPVDTETASPAQLEAKADAYDLLKDWIQERLDSPALTNAEKAVYFTVLMRIEEFENELGYQTQLTASGGSMA